jgi:hypothetical protein
LKTSNVPSFDTPLTVISPFQTPIEGTNRPSAMCRMWCNHAPRCALQITVATVATVVTCGHMTLFLLMDIVVDTDGRDLLLGLLPLRLHLSLSEPLASGSRRELSLEPASSIW